MDNLTRDGLTRMHNRAAMMEKMEELSEKYSKPAGKVGTGKRLFTVALLDLDCFKTLNDKYGHMFGDMILSEAAEIFRDEIGQRGIGGRYGGDEFILIFENVSFEQTFIILENIRRRIKDHRFEMRIEDRDIQSSVTTSIGLASFPNDGGDAHEVLRSADEALYRAKQEGRDRICIAVDQKKIPKTVYYTRWQLERLSGISENEGKSESALFREAVDLLVNHYENKTEAFEIRNRLQIQVGPGIAPHVEPWNPEVEKGLTSAIDEARTRVYKKTGILMPGVRLSDNKELGEYEIAFLTNRRRFSVKEIDPNEPCFYEDLIKLILDNLGRIILEI